MKFEDYTGQRFKIDGSEEIFTVTEVDSDKFFLQMPKLKKESAVTFITFAQFKAGIEQDKITMLKETK